MNAGLVIFGAVCMVVGIAGGLAIGLAVAWRWGRKCDALEGENEDLRMTLEGWG